MPQSTLAVPYEDNQRIWYVVREQHLAELCPTCHRNHQKIVFCVYPGDVCGWVFHPEMGMSVIVCEPHARNYDDGDGVDYTHVNSEDAFETEEQADAAAAFRQERWGG